MCLNSTIEYFINPLDKLHPETNRKGRFFVISYFIFFLFCLLAEFWILATGFGDLGMLIGNTVLTIMMAASFFIYKKYGKRILLVNILAVMGYTSNFGTYDISGGIYSSDLVNGIVICAWIFLVANKRSGQIWFLITFLTITFFYIVANLELKDFKTDAITHPSYYPYMNFGFTCVFLAIIITLHENNKEKYLKELNESKAELEIKSKELQVQHKDITDSINYAKKIQTAVLPHDETINRSIPLSFILYKPKDIVSGDFYWFNEIDKDSYIIICADCTGHGVPGAFMTVIGSNLFNQTIIDNKIYEPAKILLEVDRLLNVTLKQDSTRFQNVQDGMDLSLLHVNKTKKELIFTSAKRPVVFISDGKIQDYRGSKYSLGGMRAGEKIFEEVKINYKQDDVLYFFTDGYHDQFGGEKGKKFSSKRLKELLYTVHQKTMPEQKQKLNDEIEKWKGNLEQVDDICVMGIRF